MEDSKLVKNVKLLISDSDKENGGKVGYFQYKNLKGDLILTDKPIPAINITYFAVCATNVSII